MQVHIEGIIARLLVASGAIGTLTACIGKCPEGTAAEHYGPDEIAASAALTADIEAALAAHGASMCRFHCAPRVAGDTSDTGPSQDVWSQPWTCEYDPPDALAPPRTTCTSPDEGPFTVLTGSPEAPLQRGAFALDPEACATWCTSDESPECSVSGTTLADATMTCTYPGPSCIAGRRPLAGADSTVEGRGPGAWWVAMAQLEAASVPAFEELARDLRTHGAPSELVERALQAADDERVHTRLCRERAAARGVVAHEARPTRAGTAVDLSTLARHNAREGCVRETYAALEAGLQALHASDPADRAALQRIHHDEVRHAQLAWDVHAWARTLLGVRLDEEIASAFAELAEQAEGVGLPDADRRALGLPTPAVRRALVQGLTRQIGRSPVDPAVLSR